MYTQLLVKHFESSVPNVVSIPVPQHLRGVLAAILILSNPAYPRHFLNGCYLILEDPDASTLCYKSRAKDDNESFSSSLEVFLLSLVRCPDEHWYQLHTWSNPLFSKRFVNYRFLGWPREPNIAIPPSMLSEGPSLAMSIKPNFTQRMHAGLQCYITQLSSKSKIIDGREYFCSEYPAKSSLVEHETTLAWVFGRTTKPVGYVQYISLENDRGEQQVLITGLAVTESHRRRGLGRGLICAVVHRMWHCKEIWISVHEENRAAFSLYSKCGFATRKTHWDFSMRTEFPKM